MFELLKYMLGSFSGLLSGPGGDKAKPKIWRWAHF